jgi:hypothetical protein
MPLKPHVFDFVFVVVALVAAVVVQRWMGGRRGQGGDLPAPAMKLDDRAHEERLHLEDMLLREPPPEFGSDELRLRDALAELPKGAPEKVPLYANLAELVLESGYASRPPSSDALEEGRKLVKFVSKKLGKGSSRTLKLRMLELLAEGNAEDSLGPASELQRAVDGKQWEGEKKGREQRYSLVSEPETDDPEAVWEAYHVQAQAMVAAACEKACHARKLELLAQHAVEGAVFEKDPHKDADSARAGAMWRLMEAGRIYERANFSAPTANGTYDALDAVVATSRLRSLNAFQVSTTAKLFALGSCDMYIGVKVGGRVCLAEDANPYVKKRRRRRKKGGAGTDGDAKAADAS